MTRDQFAASRPDLTNNWSIATDSSSDLYDSADAQYIRDNFSSFDEYLEFNYGGPFDAGWNPATPPPPPSQPGSPVRGDPSHVYVGRDGRGDVWQLYDPAFDRVLEWAVQAGDDSRNRIGPVADLGPPSSMTVAQRPATTTTPGGGLPPGNPASLAKPTIQVGTTSAGLGIFQLVDSGGLVKQWIGTATSIAGDLTNVPTYGQLYHTTATDARLTGTGTPIVSGGPGPNGTTTPGGGGVAGARGPNPADPRHVFIRTISQGGALYDFYGLRDEGGALITWLVTNGSPSTAMISGSADRKPPEYDDPSLPAALRPSNNRPTIQVGTTSNGWKIFQLVDAGGTVKQWIVDAGGRVIDLVNADTYGVLFHDSVTDAAVSDHGGGVVTPTVPGSSSSSSGIDKTAIVVAIIGAAALLMASRSSKTSPAL